MPVAESDQQLRQIQKSIELGDYEEALSRLSNFPEADSSSPDFLYMQAVCYRYCRRFEDALDTLRRLKSTAPGHGRAYQEEGHIYRALSKSALALKAYERACALNPALTASFKARSDLLKQEGQFALASSIDAQIEHLTKLPHPLVAVIDLMSQGRLLRAEELCKEFMRSNPRNVEGMRLLADIAMRFGVLDDAEFLLESAIELEPDNTRLRIDYIGVLRKRQRFEKALSQAKSLLESQSDNLQFRSIFAIECMQSGDFERAVAEFDAILQLLPKDPTTLISKGHALKTLGDSSTAIACYQTALKVDPERGEAFYSLANLKTYRFTEAELSELAVLANNPNLSFKDRVYVHFALGKAFEDKHEYAVAF